MLYGQKHVFSQTLHTYMDMYFWNGRRHLLQIIPWLKHRLVNRAVTKKKKPSQIQWSSQRTSRCWRPVQWSVFKCSNIKMGFQWKRFTDCPSASNKDEERLLQLTTPDSGGKRKLIHFLKSPNKTYAIVPCRKIALGLVWPLVIFKYDLRALNKSASHPQYAPWICVWPRFTLLTGYYGLSLNSTQLSDNPYISAFISAAVEVPAYISAWLALAYLPRRYAASSAVLLGAVSLFLIQLVPQSK